jgi:hypothetical protein
MPTDVEEILHHARNRREALQRAADLKRRICRSRYRVA